MKLGRLNHVGVATPDVEAAARVYAELYGATDATAPKDFPHLGVRVVFVSVPNMQIELIEPLGEGSAIRKFLEKNPKGGQHHMCFEVPDIIAARDAMRNARRHGAGHGRALYRRPWRAGDLRAPEKIPAACSSS